MIADRRTPLGHPGDSQIGVVIVTYHSEAVIAACLEAILHKDYEIVVVDNASSDGTAALVRSFPVHLIVNSENRGFAAAANQGFKKLHLGRILLLNPDVCVTGNLHRLGETLSETDMGAVTAVLHGPTGESQEHFQFRRFPTPPTLLFETLAINRLFPSNWVNRRYRYLESKWDAPCDVDQPAGAFLLVRREAWEQVGGFDERFHPLWFEDVDFCFRLHRVGWRIRFLPELAGEHIGAHSIRHLEPGVRQLYWYRSLLRYAAKHFSIFWVRMLALSVIISLAGQAIVMALDLRHPGNSASLWPAIAMALEILLRGRMPSTGHAFE